ncbi:MAG: DUF3833 family protein [Pseudomonadota bacterium]
METLFLMLLGAAATVGVVIARRRFAAFYGQTPEDYQEGFPVIDIREHLTGTMICEGVIFGPMGRVTSSFAADFNIAWDGDTGVMDEVFRYNDGSTQVRQWRLLVHENGTFDMQADDVPGSGTGTMTGSAVQMVYPIKLPESAGGHVLSCVDWMYLTPDGTVMNRSQFRKFGFKVAELIATIRPKAV